MNTLSVVIPALNEAHGLANLIERLLASKAALAKVDIAQLELIVVDDGSCDQTAAIAASYPEVKLIQHPVNRGYGAAIKTGFYQTRGNLLAFLDADGSYPPESLPQLAQLILEDRADLVVGSRLANAENEIHLMRGMGNALFAGLISLVSHQRVTDCASGLRMLRRDLLSQLYPLPDGFNFNLVMSARAAHEQVKVLEVAIPYSERPSRSHLRGLGQSLRFLNSILMTALTYHPAQLLKLLGLDHHFGRTQRTGSQS